jgi:regulation of enolase protein 1 (concanavalin A-like superfamily)
MKFCNRILDKKAAGCADYFGGTLILPNMPTDGFTIARQFSNRCRNLARLFVLISIALFVPKLARAALPPGWSDVDIGSPALAGSAAYTSGNWTVTGGGSDIWDPTDQFNFASTTCSSDGILIARVLSLQNSDPGSGWSKAGLMFRNDTSAGSLNAGLFATATHGVSFQCRGAPGGPYSYSAVDGITTPVWLQLVRSGGTFIGYYSSDGSNWTQVGTQQIPMNGTVQAGLAVTAHNNSALNTASFTNVDLTTSIWGAYRELWTNLNSSIGNTLTVLTNTGYNPNWPNNPVSDFTHVFIGFETEVNTGRNNYGQRLRSFVVPPTNGNYIFWVASDDNSLLFLSPNENPASAVRIAGVSNWTPWRNFGVEPGQQSAPIYLQGGQRYYLEALMQQGGGGDNLTVQWQLPNGTVELPLASGSPSGAILIPFTGATTFPGIYSQPVNNTVGIESGNVGFSLLATNQANLGYQWRLNGTNLPGANACVLVVSNLSLSWSGQSYSCVVSNGSGSVTSTPSVLTVVADTNPPTVAHIANMGLTNVQIVYSEMVEAASATNTANYVFTNGLPVTGATLSPDNQTVILTTAPLTYGSNYWLVINNVRDRAGAPNTIANNTTVTFPALPYTLQDLGNPSVASIATIAGNGFDVTAAGSDFAGNSDQGSFSYQSISGNFDIAARVAGLSLSDTFAKAGLMARESLGFSSRFAAAFTTPTMNGSFFEWRDPTGAAAATSGSFPANYPNTWLRLRRSGNIFTGYASYDGQVWTQLGSATISMPAQIYFGFAVSSRSASAATSAQFRDITNVTSAVVGLQTNPHEAIGPSSRRTPIAFSEIMWKPAPRGDLKNLEFVELYNSNPWFHDISGYQIICADMNYTFPPNTQIPGGGYLVVAAVPADIQSVYGISNVMGPYTGSLKKSETLELLDEQGAVLLSVPYSSDSPWPVGTDGTGHSLVLANASYGEGDPRTWDISDTVGGSPGQMESFTPSALRNVVINEFLAHTDPPDYDYIELYNHSTSSVDISGCILTDDPATNKFIIPTPTVIPAHGFVFYSETNMNFRLDATGEAIYLLKPDHSRVLDAVQFGAQQNGVASGRWPDGANDFYRLKAKTPGTANASIFPSDVVVNELMYKPISGNDDDQYVELFNRGTNTINLGGWQLTGGVSFVFPTNTTLKTNSYLVVARNVTNLFAKYPNLNATNAVGNFSGKLAHNGEYIALTMPAEHHVSDGLGGTITNIINIVVNDLTYGTGGRWGQWANGGGSSLELIDPNSNNRLAANWDDSDETQKSVWTNIEYTGVLDNGGNYDPTIDYAQIGILDVGECLVDNIDVNYNGSNYVVNSTFEGGTASWTFQGDHSRSSLENTGYLSGHSLHMRSSDSIWTGDNSCEMALGANSLADGQTATLRFKARWLHGWPEPLMRLNGNWLEATGRMPVPNNLGTPGMPNSKLVSNAGPAIYNVRHNPSLPAASQPAVVTAQAHDANGLQNLTVFYRVDPAVSYNSVTMRDDGLSGDAIAGDGIYSATIPGQAANTLVAFYVSAMDSNSVSTRFPTIRAGNSEPVRECLVLFGDGNPSGSFATYHFWITQANVNRWANLSDLSNELNDGTFVVGNRIIYNAQGRFAGSPYHQGFDTPVGNLCHYKWSLNDDDQFLGTASLNRLHQPGNGAGDDGSLQREQVANSFLRALGVPWLNRRLVAVYVNGNRRGTLMEDAQTPDNDVVNEHFPNDTDGWLYKMQPWFEFGPAPTGSTIPFNNNAWCALNNYTTTGGIKKAARYRYNFEVRRTPVSANDFTNVYSLVDAACNPGSPTFVANLENVADMENWMRVFAANHAAGNWDSFGAQNAQNLYGYVGALGTKYTLMMFDFNISIGNGSWGPGQNLLAINGADQGMANIYSNPTFLRMYWRALGELVNGPLNVANSAPLLEAKYGALVANGLNVENPTSNIESWLSQAQASIAGQLAAVNGSSFSVNPSVTISNNVAYIRGSAPVNVSSIWINGRAYPLTWTSLTSWVVAVPLATGTNQLSITGVDRNNQFIVGDSNYVSVVYSPTNPAPIGQIVINEIMYAPAVANAEFVELYNNSTNTAFDLSGWEFQGLGYTFPAGSILWPTNYLVLAANGPAFAAAYGATNPVFDVFGGNLQANGETLTLNISSNVPVAKVKYSNQLPWPTNANAGGASLQLIDSRRDNWRVANWAAAVSGNLAAPQWTYVTATGSASSSTIYIYLQSAGDLYIDDIKLVPGSVPEAGANALANGDFESNLSGPWTVSPNLANSTLSTTIKHSGTASLHLISASAGTTQSSSIWETMSPGLNIGATYTLSFWYLQSTNGGPLTLRLSNLGITATVNPAPPTIGLATATPGAANSVASSLAAFPTLWINELQVDNLNGITNRAGQHVPWLELFNPGTSSVSLNSISLANNYTNLLQWPFPTNANIGAGQFKVIFADGQTNLTTTNELHANFVLPSHTGSLALTVAAANGQQQVLDYLDYENVNLNDSYGSYPDGQSFFRQEFFQGTPGASNNASATPPPSFIAYTTPAAIYTQNFDFLPNPGPTSVNSDNPVTINGVTYSLGNPYDFAFPALASGTGGLGISALVGWYGSGVAASKFGATDGDQTTGGQISFGLPNSANRALGLLATSSTGGTAFGVRFINGTGMALNRINLQFIGEVWRQSNLPKTLQFSYYVDPTGIAGFPAGATAFLPALNVNFPTVPGDVGGVAVDGTSPANQINLGVSSQTITNWPPSAALWLVWRMTDSSGKAQGLAIDDLSFSASAPLPVPLTFQTSGANLILNWTGMAGQSYQLEYKDNLSAPTWTPLGSPLTGNGGTLSATNSVGGSIQRFFRLRLIN